MDTCARRRTHNHTGTIALLLPRASGGTGTISASSLPYSALCSSHFPPVSDPLPLLHFNPVPVRLRADSGVSREREQERGSCPLWVAKRLPLERSSPLHHTSHNLLFSHITLWELYSAFLTRLAPPLFFLHLSLSVYSYSIYDSTCL